MSKLEDQIWDQVLFSYLSSDYSFTLSASRTVRCELWAVSWRLVTPHNLTGSLHRRLYVKWEMPATRIVRQMSFDLTASFNFHSPSISLFLPPPPTHTHTCTLSPNLSFFFPAYGQKVPLLSGECTFALSLILSGNPVRCLPGSRDLPDPPSLLYYVWRCVSVYEGTCLDFSIITLFLTFLSTICRGNFGGAQKAAILSVTVCLGGLSLTAYQQPSLMVSVSYIYMFLPGLAAWPWLSCYGYGGKS